MTALRSGSDSEGLNILRHANVGKNSLTADAETTPLRNPEFYQYDFNLGDVAEVWSPRVGAERG